MLRTYLFIPMLATVILVEVVVLVLAWRYQQVACTPQGMGILFLSIGPIGAVILTMELLRLPVAAWVVFCQGCVQKIALLVLLCFMSLMSFILVRDMMVYEMHKELSPANEFHAQALALKKTDPVMVEGQSDPIESLYRQEAQAIEKTQVHRLAIMVSLLRGEKMIPTQSVSGHALKMREEITVLRIWVYPVVAFLFFPLPPLAAMFCAAEIKGRLRRGGDERMV